MLPLKTKEEEQNGLNNNKLNESELKKWENEQLDIFSDIIISILLKSTEKTEAHEK